MDKKEAIKHYYKSLMLLAQAQGVDVGLTGPNVVIQPMEPLVDRAVKVLRRMDPNYFAGVRTINITPANPNFGFVESGPQKDPSVININMGKIKSETQNLNPEEAVFAAATTIAHERGHVTSFNEQQGFVGGEGPAEAEEARVANWIRQNQNMLKDLFQV
jgi:hypothetical protein